MKVVPFLIPKTEKEALKIQIDKGNHFYENLHQHPEIQIMFILKSEGVLIAGDYIGSFKEGDIFVIGKNQAHVFRNDKSFFHPNSLNKAEGISLFFDAHYFGDYFWHLNDMATVRQFVKQATSGLRVLGESRLQVAQLMLDIVKKKGLDRLITFFSILKTLSESTQVEQLALLDAKPNASLYDDTRMNDILTFTFQEYQNPISIQTVADIAHLTPEAFCRYFKLRTRKTYWRFLYEVRINQACKLLSNPQILVSEVAYQVGFNNLSNFNRAFKMIMHETPKAYCTRIQGR